MPENARNPESTDPEGSAAAGEAAAGPAPPDDGAAASAAEAGDGATSAPPPAPNGGSGGEPASTEAAPADYAPVTARVVIEPLTEPVAVSPAAEIAAEPIAAEPAPEPVTAVRAAEPATAEPAAESVSTKSAAETVTAKSAAETVTAKSAAEPMTAEPAGEIVSAEPEPARSGAEPAAAAPVAEPPAAEAPGAAPAPEAQAAEAAPPAPEAPAAETPAAEAPAAAPAPGEAPAAAAPPGEASAAPAAAAEAAAAEPVEETEEVKALRAAKEAGLRLEGKVIGWNRGGFHVALEGGHVTAFCPNSEMELGRPRAPETYVDRTLAFKVIKVQRRGRRVVLSRQAVLKEERGQRLADLRGRPGAVLKGTVTSITDFGAFVDLGGLEGLVHVSELSRRRVAHAKEAVALGQEVEVKVLKIDQQGERISLSIKALEPDPWRGVAGRYPAGSPFTGKIARKTEFGLFVELEPEIDGLVHLSRLPPGAALDDPSLAVGETISGWVQEVDGKRKRVSLSLREIAKGDPWKGIEERFAEGAVVQGTVESAAQFGVFINLEPGLTGLLPTSEMGVPKGTNPARLYSPGQKVAVQVVGIDKRRKRISLAREGSRIEGSRADYQAYRKRQQETGGKGMGALAHALAKIRDERVE